MKLKKYQVSRLFVSGNLKGIKYTEKSSIYFPVGNKVYSGFGSAFKIIDVKEVK